MARKGKRQRPEKHKQSMNEQIEDPETYGVRATPRNKRQKPEERDDALILDEKTRAKIMREAREQQEDLEAEENVLLTTRRERNQGGEPPIEADFESDSEDGSEANGYSEMGSVWEEDIEVSPEDEEAMAAFLNPQGPGFKQTITLADIILEKIKEKQERALR